MFARLLPAVALVVTAVSSPALAAPAQAPCGDKVVLLLDEARWRPSKPLNPAGACDVSFTRVDDPGYQVMLTMLPLRPAEVPKAKKMPPLQHLQRMLDMLSKGNQGPKLDKAEKSGPFHHAFGQGEGPSGNPYHTHVAVRLVSGAVFYVLHTYEPHRSDKKAAYDQAAARAELLGWLEGIKLK